MTATVPSINPASQRFIETRQTLILAISPYVEDYTALCRILEGSEWPTLACQTCGQARQFLKQASIVLCEQKLPDGDWKQVLKELQNMLDPPLLIVTSRLADSTLWAEVLNLGGYDVLAKPFREKEVLWTIATAHRYPGAPRLAEGNCLVSEMGGQECPH